MLLHRLSRQVVASTSRIVQATALNLSSAAQIPPQIKTTTNANVITIEVEPAASTPKLLHIEDPHDACVLCRLGVEVKYDDVLILRQFMRNDGTVLPRQYTGICNRQQRIVERCVMQAHMTGLFPISMRPSDVNDDAMRGGYKKYARHWHSHNELYRRVLDTRRGSWYYIKRFERYNWPNSANSLKYVKHSNAVPFK